MIQTASPNPENTTSYQYDPDGNLTNLTDANTHTTLNGFDFLGQLNLEAMPAGQQQTRTYDAAGNLQTLTDYNGKTTTFAYDTLNRLMSRTPDPSLPDTPESFTYTATGKRATMTDASGTTIYTYDAQDRLQTQSHAARHADLHVRHGRQRRVHDVVECKRRFGRVYLRQLESIGNRSG